MTDTLTSLLSNPATNRLEIYLKFKENVSWPAEMLQQLKNRFQIKGHADTIEYRHKSLTYVINCSDNLQHTLEKESTGYMENDTEYIIATQTNVIPNHQFPSTTDINDKSRWRRSRFKKNNRLSIHVDQDRGLDDTCPIFTYVYLQYIHDDAIDMEKMIADFATLRAALHG